MSIIHIYPVDDWIEHQTCGFDCLCEPEVQFIDPETGLPYSEGGALIIHVQISDDQEERK